MGPDFLKLFRLKQQEPEQARASHFSFGGSRTISKLAKTEEGKLTPATSTELNQSEIKPRFWRCATAKSIEDLIRALRKKRRSKRIFKVEDYFFFKEQGLFMPQLQKNALFSETSEGVLEADELTVKEQPIIPNAVFERTIVEPPIAAKTESFFTDVKIIKPFIKKDVLRIISYGAVSDKSSPQNSPASGSLITFDEKDSGNLIQQCMDNANVIFKKIDEVIEENKKITEQSLGVAEKKANPYSQMRKFKNKNFSPLEALSKIEEINNIIDFKKSNNRTDIILPSKYLPGQQTTAQQEEFVKNLQKKLEKLQQTYQHWTKWQEEYSAIRLSAPKRIRKKFRN